MRLKDKLTIITAAASGMGRAGCSLFTQEGATVAAVDIDAGRLADVVAEVTAAGGRIKGFTADLSKVEDTHRVMAEATAWLGGLDVLWAHAGSPGPATVENLDLEGYEHSMALNVRSAVLCAGDAVGPMRKRGGGAIVFTASVSGLVGSMMSPIYSAAKFGVVGLGKSLALQFAPDKVRVNVVCPGPIDTPMLPAFMSRSGSLEERAANEAKFTAAIPWGRFGRADEIAKAALWLASDDAEFVTGIALPVDGGFTAR